MEELAGVTPGEFGGNLKRELKKLFPPASAQLSIVASKGRNRIFGDYQCNDVLNMLSPKPFRSDFAQATGQHFVSNFPASEMVKSCSVTGAGFINFVISDDYIAKSIENMLINGIDTWAPTLPVKRAVVDFYSPNVAEDMHVGHLRSPIIGETIARLIEYSKVQVLRRNHVGDWGTNAGMLIEYLFEVYPGAVSESMTTIGHIQGESFYKPYISNMIEELTIKGLVEEIDGARDISIEGSKKPLMLVKRDGGFTYSTTDMAALWYRLNEEKAEWIIYVTEAGQHNHFDKLFKAARKAGWLPTNDTTYPRVSHVGFGVVLGGNGRRLNSWYAYKFRLADLLDMAKYYSKRALIERGKDKEWTLEELDETAEAVGYSTMKFADLKNNRLTSYTFNYDQMLCDKGKTAFYLLYAHARICSIIQKSGTDIDELKKEGKLALDHEDERALGLHLLRFSETVEEACTKLLPNVLCDYLYGLSEQYSRFYNNCQVIGSAEETSRLLLCEATGIVMRKCFHLLGITPVYKL